MVRRVLWLAYRAPQSELRTKRFWLHKMRDAGSFGMASNVLGSLGYVPGPILFNFPGQPAEANFEWIGPDDLILITTRPPLNDKEEKHKKPVDRSGTALEERVFRSLRGFLSYCSRSKIEVCQAAETRLCAAGRAEWASADFRVNADASVITGDQPISACRTLGYLIASTQTWPGGPRILALFSVGGTESLVWSYLLCTRHRELLRGMVESQADGFLVGEFTFKLEVGSVPESLQFADNCSMELVRCL